MNEPRLRSIDLLGPHCGRDLCAGEDATLRRQRADEGAGQSGAAGFRRHQMGDIGGEDLVAMAAMHHHRDQIAHCAGGQEQPARFPEESGDALAQGIDARILAGLLVADGSGRHGSAHTGARLRFGIAAQLDDLLGHQT
jgi:hypothetical protein